LNFTSDSTEQQRGFKQHKTYTHPTQCSVLIMPPALILLPAARLEPRRKALLEPSKVWPDEFGSNRIIADALKKERNERSTAMRIRVNGKPATSGNLVALAVTSVGLILPSQGAIAKNPNPGVLPPNSAPHGLTYGEWSARWFKWAYEPPPAENPLLDTSGANCANGQSGHVWFLAGTFNGGTVVRSCTIPPGQMLFFPVGNGFCVGDPGFDFAAERACATQQAAGLSNFRVEVDEAPVAALSAPLVDNYYRALSSEWDLVLGADNVFGVPAGTYSPGAGDGVYLMLTPLPPGQHTLHIHAVSGGGQIDATYNLTVGR
jgi:hypothetical protein